MTTATTRSCGCGRRAPRWRSASTMARIPAGRRCSCGSSGATMLARRSSSSAVAPSLTLRCCARSAGSATRSAITRSPTLASRIWAELPSAPRSGTAPGLSSARERRDRDSSGLRLGRSTSRLALRSPARASCWSAGTCRSTTTSAIRPRGQRLARSLPTPARDRSSWPTTDRWTTAGPWPRCGSSCAACGAAASESCRSETCC